MKSTSFNLILAPVNTEKARAGWADNPKGRTYIFLVPMGATKAAIKVAVEEAFSVKVADVRTMNRPGKVRRRGMRTGRRPETRRAIVRLVPDQKIAFFDGI
jgi:large subunit ribosomal protein L23